MSRPRDPSGRKLASLPSSTALVVAADVSDGVCGIQPGGRYVTAPVATHLEQSCALDLQAVRADEGAGLPVHRGEAAPVAPPTLTFVEEEPLEVYSVASGDERAARLALTHDDLSASALNT
jgi:hypothetical protein